jgi:hypothetical protein
MSIWWSRWLSSVGDVFWNFGRAVVEESGAECLNLVELIRGEAFKVLVIEKLDFREPVLLSRAQLETGSRPVLYRRPDTGAWAVEGGARRSGATPARRRLSAITGPAVTDPAQFSNLALLCSFDTRLYTRRSNVRLQSHQPIHLPFHDTILV